MIGLTPEGVRGSGNTFFFSPYSGTQFDPPKPVPKPVHYPVVHADGKTFRSLNQNSIYDVRATYPADHVLRREFSSPPEVFSASISAPTLSDLFLRAQIPEEDEALKKMQEEEWRQRVWNVPTTLNSVKAVAMPSKRQERRRSWYNRHKMTVNAAGKDHQEKWRVKKLPVKKGEKKTKWVVLEVEEKKCSDEYCNDEERPDVVVEKQGGMDYDEEDEKACAHPCTVCPTEPRRRSRNTMRDIFDKYSTFIAVLTGMCLVQAANAQALDADDEAMPLYAFLFGDIDLFTFPALPGFPSFSLNFLSSTATLAVTALSPSTLTYFFRCFLLPLVIFSPFLIFLLSRIREHTRAYEKLCLFCWALILCFDTLGTKVTIIFGLAVLVKQIIPGPWSIGSRLGDLLAYVIEAVLEAVYIVAASFGEWVGAGFSGAVDIAREIGNVVLPPISRFGTFVLEVSQVTAISICDHLGQVELVVSRKTFWLIALGVVVLGDFLVQEYSNGLERKPLVRRLVGDAGFVRTVTIY